MLKHTTTSSQGGSCSDLDSSRSNRMVSSNSSIDESFETTRQEDLIRDTSRKEGNRNLTLELRIPHTQEIAGSSVQKPRSTSFTNISNNDEEFVEEIQKGDKTLTYYKRRSISPAASTPSEDVVPSANDYNDLNIQRSSIALSPVRYQNDFWRSQDDLLPSSPPHASKQNKNKNENTKTKTPTITKHVSSRDTVRGGISPQTPCTMHSRQTFNSGKYRIFSPTRRSKPSSIERPEDEQRKSSHHNLSVQSDDSSDRRYLDLSVDRNDISVIPNRNIRTVRKQRAPSVSADSSVSKYLSNVSSRIDSRDCRSPGSISMTIPAEVNNNNIHHSNNHPIIPKTPTTECNDTSIQDIIDRRTQICKFIAIFCIILTSIVCVLVGILHFYVGYYPEVLYLNQGDVKLVSASSSFCSSVKAVSRTSSLRVIAFKRKSRLKNIENTITGRYEIYPANVWSRDFYLLQGSSVKVKINTPFNVEFMVFVGKKKFSIWSQRMQSETYLKTMECCRDTQGNEKTMYFNVSRDENYFIAIHNHVEVIPVSVNLEITFIRKSYDFTDTTHHCLAETPGIPCSVDYTFNNGEYAALEIPLSNKRSTIPRSSEVEWECVARVWFYVVLFVVVFIVIGAGIFTCYYVSVTICIPSGRYCCMIYDKKNDESLEFIYHNKYIKKKEDNFGMDVDGIVSSERSQFASTNKVPLYYQIDPGASYTRPLSSHLKEEQHKMRGDQRTEIDIATIYERNRESGDAADSGISIGVDYVPTRQSYREEIIKLRELQIQQLKTKYPPQERTHASVVSSRDNCSYEDT